jgi:hypothetical protein
VRVDGWKLKGGGKPKDTPKKGEEKKRKKQNKKQLWCSTIALIVVGLMATDSHQLSDAFTEELKWS